MKAIEANYDAGAHWELRGDLATAMKWRAAFKLFLKGETLKAISEALDLSYDSVRSKAQAEGDDWGAARQQLVLARLDPQSVAVVDVEKQIARIKENREQNLGDLAKLRTVAVDIIDKLVNGKLVVEKVFNGKMGVTRVECAPSTGDLVNIGTFLRTVQDLTYRALGDVAADSKQTPASASASATQPPPGITVILPSIAVNPRPRRRQAAKATVTDIEAEVQPGVAIDPSPAPLPDDGAATS